MKTIFCLILLTILSSVSALETEEVRGVYRAVTKYNNETEAFDAVSPSLAIVITDRIYFDVPGGTSYAVEGVTVKDGKTSFMASIDNKEYTFEITEAGGMYVVLISAKDSQELLICVKEEL